ncbi:MAG: ABC transporter substrate-binding protein [Burkholderiaceae bacterium]|nr:MAG: ABC transporter substrate-binding protein [Burkholderiaceae bacterium]
MGKQNTMSPVKRRFMLQAALSLGLPATLVAPWARAADQDPNAFIQNLSNEILSLIHSDKAVQNGNVARIRELVDSKIMPNVNFTRMTASAVGPAWRQATPEQKQQLEKQFETLLIRTYAGALNQVKNQTVDVQPFRGNPNDNDVVVRTLVKGSGEPIQLDYRLERTPGKGGGWKIYDLNVIGVWLVANYRSQFAEQVNRGGIPGLIKSLQEHNAADAAADKKNS